MGGDSNVSEASQRLGLPAELIEDAENFSLARDGVYPDNMQIARVFADMLTQWRVSGTGGVVGLDYAALPVVFKIRSVKKKHRQEVFDGVQVMEYAAIRVIRQRNG